VIDSSVDSFITGNFNLIGSGNAANGFTATDDLVILDADPLLGPLTDNGGPTETHALLPGSHAIDAGSSDDPFDQRGAPFLRSVDNPSATGSGVDIGALEQQMLANLNLIVDTTIDERDGNYSAGDLSLREAVALANGSSGADTITFDPTVFTGGQNSLIRLTLGELEIAEELEIDGATAVGVVITADASGDDTVVPSTFLTDAAASVASLLDDNSRVISFIDSTQDLTLSGLTITGGRTTGFNDPGAGISFLSGGSLFLNEVTVSGNSTSGFASHGGGIYVDSSFELVVNRSTVSGNRTTGLFADGGGIATESFSSPVTVTVVDSIVRNNSTEDGKGGGIFADSVLTLAGSTISSNSATGDFGDGGGVSARTITATSSTFSGNFSGDNGGGIASTFDAVLTNSTVSGNSSLYGGGGIHISNGDLTLRNSTVAENSSGADGGGIFLPIGVAGTVLTIENSIVANNSASGLAPDLRPRPADQLDINYTLIGDTSDSRVTTATGTGNLIDISPLLAPLGFYGGPTQTHALLSGSPAIDAGVPTFTSPPNFDQRSAPYARVFGGRIDIGAYERQTLALPPLIVDTVTDEVDGNYSIGNLSLREAIGLATGNVGADMITFDAAVFDTPQTISLVLGEMQITDTLTIAGPGQNLLSIDAQQESRIFNIDDGNDDNQIDVMLSGMTLTGGRADDGAPGEPGFSGHPLLEQGKKGRPGANGGAIFSRENLTITGANISGNAAGNGGIGGAGLSMSGTVGSDIAGRGGQGGDGGQGGAIRQIGASLNIVSSTLTENSSGNGGIGGLGGSVSNSFGNDFAGDGGFGGGSGVGGAISHSGGTLTIFSSTISGNETGRGGIGGTGGNTSNPSFNVGIGVPGDGGGGGFSNNGGGVNIGYSGNLTINNSTLSGNATGLGGGGGYRGRGFVQGALVRIGNLGGPGSRGDGGGVASGNFDQSIVQSSTISGNSARQGGGIYARYGATSIQHSTITENSADNEGGGVWSFSGSNFTQTDVGSSIIAGNSAPESNDVYFRFSSNQTNTFQSLGYNLVGSGNATGAFNALGDQSGVDPLLASLVDNGGPTLTHAILSGSPAIDAGDPNFSSTPNFDQRGASFLRVGNGRIDIGAYEVQITAPADFDQDVDVDGADFLAWQRGFGTSNASPSDGDANGDQTVDAADLAVWQGQFGQTVSSIVAASTAPPLAPVQASIEPVGPVEVANVVELAAISVQPLAVSSPFSVVTVQSAETPAVQAPTIGRRAELIDAAIAFESIRGVKVEESPVLEEELIFAETYTDRVFAAEVLAPASPFVDAYERPGANSSEDDAAEDAWLTEELLELVFG